MSDVGGKSSESGARATSHAPIFMHVYRWDRHGRKGQFCRIETHGRKTNAVLVQFEDGGRLVCPRNAILLRKEFKRDASGRSALGDHAGV